MQDAHSQLISVLEEEIVTEKDDDAEDKELELETETPPPLSVVGPSSECYIYDTNYNVLRIMSGMGGLAYSN